MNINAMSKNIISLLFINKNNMTTRKVLAWLANLFHNTESGSIGMISIQILRVVESGFLLLDIINIIFAPKPIAVQFWEWIIIDSVSLIFINLAGYWAIKCPSHKWLIGLLLYADMLLVNNESIFIVPNNNQSFLINSAYTELLGTFIFNDTISSIFNAALIHFSFFLYSIFSIKYRKTRDLALFDKSQVMIIQFMMLALYTCSSYYIMNLRGIFLKIFYIQKRTMSSWKRVMSIVDIGISIELGDQVQFRNNKFYKLFDIVGPANNLFPFNKIEIGIPYKYSCNKYTLQITKQYIRFDASEKIKSFMFIINDVTNITKGEQEKYNQMLVATVTHELRTPLNIMSAIFYKIRDELNDEQMKEDISKGICAASLQECLINDVMDVAKISHNQLKIQRTKIDIKQCLMNIYSLFKFKVDKTINFTINLEKTIPKFIMIDEKRYRQIVLNLLSNSTKFTAVGFINISAKYESNCLTTSVADSGIGIMEKDRPKIFTKFGMVDETRNMNQSGSGLGLNLCKYLVECMEGDINFISSPHVCTQFTFTIKCQIGGENLLDCIVASSFLGNKTFKVLAIDDDLMNLSILQMYAKKGGYPCKVFSHFKDLMQSNELDNQVVIFIDLNMPEISGYDCALKLNDPNSFRVMIALTGEDSESVKEKCLLCGFKEVLEKPLKYEAYKACVERYITAGNKDMNGPIT